MSDDFEPRTRETHNDQCKDLDGPLHDQIATTYGIDCDSFLNTSCFFHVTEGLAPDIMHDTLEGCLEYEAKELLEHFTQLKLISHNELNNTIESFPYRYSDVRNKPSTISD